MRESITINGIEFKASFHTGYVIFSGGELIGDGRLNLHGKNSCELFYGIPYESGFERNILPDLKAELLKRLIDKTGNK
jgi:hypothetical protein